METGRHQLHARQVRHGDGLPVLLFFRSVRSGLARRMESLVTTVAYKHRDRLRVIPVDVDAQPEVAARFQVVSVPTLVLVDRRRVLARLEERATLAAIEDLLAEKLPAAATEDGDAGAGDERGDEHADATANDAATP